MALVDRCWPLSHCSHKNSFQCRCSGCRIYTVDTSYMAFATVRMPFTFFGISTRNFLMTNWLSMSQSPMVIELWPSNLGRWASSSLEFASYDHQLSSKQCLRLPNHLTNFLIRLVNDAIGWQSLTRCHLNSNTWSTSRDTSESASD